MATTAKGRPPRAKQKPNARRAVPKATKPRKRRVEVAVGTHLSATDELEVIEKGAPVAFARELQHELDLTQERLSAALGIAKRTLANHMTAERFGHDESDRVLRLKRIYEQALDTFEGRREAAIAWFQANNRALGGRTPIELIGTSSGSRAVEQVLGRMEHGLYS